MSKKRKADDVEPCSGLEVELELAGDGEWLSLDFGQHTFFVHPSSGRVCDEPEGTVIGEFDAEAGEVSLFAEDGECAGAQEIQSSKAAENVLSEMDCQAFAEIGFWQLDAKNDAEALLPSELVQKARAELEVLLAAGSLSALHTQTASTRSDRVAYLRIGEEKDKPSDLLEALPSPPGCLEAVSVLENLVATLDQRLHLGLLKPCRCMVSCYEPGSFYVPHRDNSKDEAGTWRNSRSLTAIVYLNEAEWPQDRGGCLRCYLGAAAEDSTGSSAQKVVDVLPSEGRVVLFDSRRLLHEVRPTNARRFALSIWFVAREESHALKPQAKIPEESSELQQIRKAPC